MNIEQLIQQYGKPYSEELSIDLKSCRREEISKWFLASILFASRISETIAKKTYREFENRNISTAEKISATDWHDLVAILDAGGYTRYDFKTADRLLEVFGNLRKYYNGDLNDFTRQNSIDMVQLETALLRLGKNLRKSRMETRGKNSHP